jgi:hypothetical protein
VQHGIASEQELEAIRAQADEEIATATEIALASPQPPTDTVYQYVYSPDVDPTSEQFDTEDDPHFTGEPTTMVDLLNSCMKDELARDPRILVFGEDVADASRDQFINQVKGRAASSRSPGDCRRRSAATGSTTRRSPRRTSSAVRSAWRRAGSSRWSRFSSSTTSGRRTCRSGTSSPSCGGARTMRSAARS